MIKDKTQTLKQIRNQKSMGSDAHVAPSGESKYNSSSSDSSVSYRL